MNPDSEVQPTALYRLQIHGDFTLVDAKKLVPYLHSLGISHLYLSPLTQPQRGSKHGYDVVNYSVLHPEAGGMSALEALVHELNHHGMGIILDIVPNHCALSLENPWILDLLEYGPLSRRFLYFDIHRRDARSRQGKIVLPLLEKEMAMLIDEGEIKIVLKSEGFFLRLPWGDLPLNPFSYPPVLRKISGAIDSLPLRKHISQTISDLALVREEYADLLRANGGELTAPSFRKDIVRLAKRLRGVKERLLNGVPAGPDRPPDRGALSAANIRKRVQDSLPDLIASSPDRASLLLHLLEEQWYLPVHWETGEIEINYRRFFNINHLIALRMEDPEVFRETHGLVRDLLERDLIQGLRVDHIDGLRHPDQYLQALSQLTGAEPCYLIVEKILAPDEDLSAEWPVSGSSGYDFLNHNDALFISAPGLAILRAMHDKLGSADGSFAAVSREAQIQIQQEVLLPELNHILEILWEKAAGIGREAPSATELRRALLELTAALAVYRTYISDRPDPVTDRLLNRAVEEAGHHTNTAETRALDFIARMLQSGTLADEADGELRSEFIHAWQQYTGAVMAKGVEDTALFRQTTLSDLNEVGGDPGRSAFRPEEFHEFVQRRRERFPDSLNATSTHDTKRSEDARSRLHLLTEYAGEWEGNVRAWLQRHMRWPETGGSERKGVDIFTILTLYQNLFAIWPAGSSRPIDLAQRLKNHSVKSSREAKIRSCWERPDLDFEEAISRFIDRLFTDERFQRELDSFVTSTEKVFLSRSLARTLLKITVPGIPDFYQGNELWNFRLTDPDNRASVDFEVRKRALDRFPSPAAGARELTACCRELLCAPHDGCIKLYLIRQALILRRQHPGLFARGEYLPLFTEREDIFAFARLRGKDYALIIVPRPSGPRSSGDGGEVATTLSGEEALSFPQHFPQSWINQITGQRLEFSPERRTIPVRRLFEDFPVALLRN